MSELTHYICTTPLKMTKSVDIYSEITSYILGDKNSSEKLFKSFFRDMKAGGILPKFFSSITSCHA